MTVKKLSTSGNSCNFCSRGKLSESGVSLIYPYDRVYEVGGTGIIVRFCPDCVKNLTDAVILSEVS